VIQALGTKEQRLYQRDEWFKWPDLDLTVVHSLTHKDAIEFIGLTPKQAGLLIDGLNNKKWLDEELELFEQHPEFRLLTIFDKEYPILLSQIHLPPPVLYLWGQKLSPDSLKLAMVGSRNAGFYAASVVKKLVPEFVAHDWELVSGGALGVDSLVHQTTIAEQGKTIVVLGSGLLDLYPASNRKLFEKIAADFGTVISAFPFRALPDKGNFPARNRIISGLSLGTVIIQAAEKSGALITAQYALEQGRQVFAVPGSITDPLSAGCHALIKDGAKLVTCVRDIVEEFGMPDEAICEGKQEVVESFKSGTNGEIQGSIEHYLLAYLQEPQTIDTLLEQTKNSIAILQGELFELQLEGIVTQNHAGYWQKKF